MTASLRRKSAAGRIVTSLILSGNLWIFGASPSGANSISPLCAKKDLQAITVIEEHGERQNVSADRLTVAASVMQIARKACLAGHIEVALAIYDLIHPEIILAHRH